MRTIVAVGVACLLAGVAAAQGVAPLGDQVQVNSYVTGSQTNPALATDAGGAAVVVWTGTSSGGNDSSQTSIQSRRLDASGALLGADFQVNTTTPGYQLRPAVATQPGGEFVVVWGSASPSGNDSSYSVEARRFDAAGLPLASQFQLNSYTTSVQEFPAVAAAADGGFLMVWHSTGSFGADSAGRSIQARRYSAAGAPFGAELEVNAYTPGDQMDPAVAALPSGDFAVVWNNISGSPGDSSERSIQGRLVDADGVPLGGEFQVNSFTPGTQYNPAVAALADGGFVVVWSSATSPAGDTDFAILGQRFDASGAPLGDELQVNTSLIYVQSMPAVAGGDDGSFLVAWRSGDFASGGVDGDRYGIAARAFAGSGTPLGDELVVNTYTSGLQESPAVAAAPDGRYLVAWQSNGSWGNDTTLSIQARAYEVTALVFWDGFETGDAGRWSVETP